MGSSEQKSRFFYFCFYFIGRRATRKIEYLVHAARFWVTSGTPYVFYRRTQAPTWHEETSSKRDCCCTRGGPRCEVARWLGHPVRGARRPGDQARCKLLYTAGASSNTQPRTRESLPFILCVGFHCPAWLWLGGSGSRDYLPARATLPRARATKSGRGPQLAP